MKHFVITAYIMGTIFTVGSAAANAEDMQSASQPHPQNSIVCTVFDDPLIKCVTKCNEIKGLNWWQWVGCL